MTTDSQGPTKSFPRFARRIALLASTPDGLVVGWALCLKILLLFLGVSAFRAIGDQPLRHRYGAFTIWNRWDALHYQQIAQAGYGTKPSGLLDFYPLYPWCIRLVAFFAGNYFLSALIVSTAASLLAVVLFRRLVALDYGTRISLRAAWFFLIFPTAYFLHIGYTESLFLCLGLGSFLAVRHQRWWLAGVCGALCWMTRPTGLALFPALLTEAGIEFWKARRWNWQWLWIFLVPIGFAVFLYINFCSAGDVFAFLHVRRSVFATRMAWPWQGIRHLIGDFHRHPNQAEMVGAQEIYFVALGFVGVVFSWIKLRPSYAMWITVIWSLFSCASFIQSVPRHTLTLFPLFILFARIGRYRLCYAIITVWSLLFLAMFSSLFVRGWWAF